MDNLTGQTDTVETQETGGTVTAVTSEEDAAGDGAEAQGEDSGQADAQTQDSGQPADEGQDSDAQDAAAGSDETGSGTADSSTADSGDADSSSSDSTESADAQSSKSGAADSSGENGSNGIYVVEKGDTLAIISRKMYGDLNHVDAICRMNGITDGNLIYVGQKLLLP